MFYYNTLFSPISQQKTIIHNLNNYITVQVCWGVIVSHKKIKFIQKSSSMRRENNYSSNNEIYIRQENEMPFLICHAKSECFNN